MKFEILNRWTKSGQKLNKIANSIQATQQKIILTKNGIKCTNLRSSKFFDTARKNGITNLKVVKLQPAVKSKGTVGQI